MNFCKSTAWARMWLEGTREAMVGEMSLLSSCRGLGISHYQPITAILYTTRMGMVVSAIQAASE